VLTLTSSDSPSIPPGAEPRLFTVQSQVIRLRCTTAVDSSVLKRPIGIKVSVSERPGTEPYTLPLAINPRQPDRIRLVVQQLRNNQVYPIDAPTNGSVGPASTRVWPALPILAVQGVSGKFRFSLQNLASKPKRCVAQVYILRGPQAAGAPVSVEMFRREVVNGGLQPAFVSTAADLPLSDISGSETVRLTLKAPGNDPAPAAAGAAAPANSGNQSDGNWLLFEVREVDGTDKPLPKEPTYELCQLTAESPDLREVVSISSARKGTGRLQLRVEARPDVWREYGIKNLKLRAEATDEEGSEVAVTPDGKTNFEQTLELDQPVFEMDFRPDPTLVPAPEIVAHISLGGYPRAIAYHLERGEPERLAAAFAKLGTLQARADERSELFQPLDLPQQPGAYTFSASDKDGSLRYETLYVQAKLDCPRHLAVKPVIRLLNRESGREERSQALEADRRFQFQPKAEAGGDLAIAATALDVACELTAGLRDGRYTLEAACGNVRSTREIIFDSTPPEKAAIQVSSGQGPVVEDGQVLDLSLTPHDELSGVKEVFMAVDTQNSKPGYDAADKPQLGGVRKADGEWQFLLDTATLAEIQRRAGSVRIVAKSVDFSGNEQTDNKPLEIRIRPAAKPADDSK
jgi:hypothetical protein